MVAVEINLTVIFAILIIHFIADFIVQTEWQAQNKSSNIYALIAHVITYSLCWIPFVMYYNLHWFVTMTFIIHLITDYFTSRLNKKLIPERQFEGVKLDGIRKYSFPYGENFHNFFVGVGFDQLLHYTQLILTYLWLR